jgi:hypothetical protein
MTDWSQDDASQVEQRWTMASTHLLPRERWLRWQQIWADVCATGSHLARSGGGTPRRSKVARRDSGEWDDHPGKLALLWT